MNRRELIYVRDMKDKYQKTAINKAIRLLKFLLENEEGIIIKDNIVKRVKKDWNNPF